MTKKFIVYIINLKKDEERKKNILRQVKKQKIKNYELIAAVDGNNLTEEELNLLTYKNKKSINPWNTKMSPSQIGCALSHIKIYRKLIKSNYDFALILEDDAYFLRDLTEKLQNFITKNLKYKKQILLLSELKEFISKPLDKFNDYEVVNVTNAFFTHSYFINKKAAESIIKFNYPVKTIADNFVLFHIYCKIKISGLNPFLLGQDTKKFKTSITDFTNNNEKIFLIRKLIYKMKNKIFKKFIKFKSHKNLT
tara:strand:- start:1165 stop:1920 length:756 start_codon:yes stop_codon:yes gene_type:complete